MPAFFGSSYDVAHLLDTSVLILSFAFLYQRRLYGIIKVYAYQALFLAAAAAWQAHAQAAPDLFITAAIAIIFKAIIIPVALHRIIIKLNIQGTIETAIGIGATLTVGVALVGLSILLVLPVTASSGALTRESLAIALSVVLLGFLIMITRHNAISQVVGFMSMENGLDLAGVGVKGMPLVVELSAAFSVMVAFIIFGIFFFHIRERFDTLDVHDMEKFRGERR